MDRTERYTQKEHAVTELKEKLKEIGMYEDGMTKDEMTQLLSAVNASVNSADNYNDFKNILEESVLKSQELDQVREDLHETIDKVEKQISPTKSEESETSKYDNSFCQPTKANKFFKSANYDPLNVSVTNWVDCKNKGVVNKGKKNRNKNLSTSKKTKNIDVKNQTNEENTNCLMKSNKSVTPVKCVTEKSPQNVNTKQKHLKKIQSIDNNNTKNVSPKKSVDKKMTENSSESSSNRVDEKKHCVTNLEKKRHISLFREKYDLKCQLNEQPFFLVKNSKAKMLSIDVQAKLVNIFLSRQVQRIALYQKSLKSPGTRIGKPIVTSENFNGCLERNPFEPPEEESDVQNNASDKQKSESDDDFVAKQTHKEEKIFQRNTRKRMKSNDEIVATSKLFADVSRSTSNKNQAENPYSEISLIIRGDDKNKEKKVGFSELMERINSESSVNKEKVFKTRSDAMFDALKNNVPTENIVNIPDKSDSDSDCDRDSEYIPERKGRRVPPPNPFKSNPGEKKNNKKQKLPKVSMQYDGSSDDLFTGDEKETEQCPICNGMFSVSKIVRHASICTTGEYDHVDIGDSSHRPLKRRNTRTPAQQESKRNKLNE